MRELGYEAPEETARNYQIMGKTFDYTQPDVRRQLRDSEGLTMDRTPSGIA